MSFVFHPEAEKEFKKANEYYEGIDPLLGNDYAIEVYSSIQLAVSFPKAWPTIDGNIHRTLIKRLPYGVLYTKAECRIYILAVMHLNRNPDYWKHRK
jgi:hypothetical protein